MRITRGPLIKVLTFVLTMGFLIAMVGIVFARVRIQPSDEYSAVFTDASGLTSGSDVRGNGVAVGSVKSIELGDDGTARVSFTVAKTVALTDSTKARIRYANLTGDRYLDLTPGTEGAQALSPGGTIPVGRTQPALDLDQFFQGFDPLMRALDADQVNELAKNVISVTQGESGAVQAMLANVGSFTSRLAERDDLIGETITNLSEALALLNDHRGDLDQLVTGLSGLMKGYAKDRKVIGASLSSINDAAKDTADLLARVRPDLKANIDQMGVLAGHINANSDDIRDGLDKYPAIGSKVARLGSYGSFFNFYLCGVKLKIDLPGDDLDVYSPWVKDDTGRCGGIQK